MNADWLTRLAPAHAPPPAPWWPPAPGWWGLALLVLAALAGGVWWWNRPRLRLRRAALRELAALERGGHDEISLAVHVQDLLRRHAIARHGREMVARLAGQNWLAFLAEHGGNALAGTAGERLLRAAYAGETPALPDDSAAPLREAWLAGARGFIVGKPARRRRYDN